ncbi:MAG: hypothetical protein HC886_14865 [Leptolyngbyaceae cyanobacterium SM1_1_3]|nr:hypothetical protein [Leptolyngbyaceae cyanobacterium SM1_1_3]NJN03769.1 hypothetical protein [Leptolyngbyaceae cyanobacterium RM1_1_2]NJO08513.1 hypothetical protein [Leptolyngbyaceae cyanobacterium SL_1_1]
MSVSIPFEQEAKKVVNRTTNPSNFSLVNRQLRSAAGSIRQDWKDLSSQQREDLKQFAYTLIEPREANVWTKLRARLYVLRVFMTGRGEDFIRCLDALDSLVDNILDAAERDQPEYNQILSDTIENISSSSSTSSEILEIKDSNGWIQRLSNQALEEV